MNDIPILNVETKIVTLPYSQKQVTIRPILVKEEKILLMANENLTKTKDGDDPKIQFLSSLIQVVQNCMVKSDKKAIDLHPTDFRFIYTELRKISKGNSLKLSLQCDVCEREYNKKLALHQENPKEHEHPGHKTHILNDADYDIDDIVVITDDKPPKNSIVKITDNYGFKMKHSSFAYLIKILSEMQQITPERFQIKEITDHIIGVLQDEEQYDIKTSEQKEFLIEHLTNDQYKKLKEWLNAGPKIYVEVKFNCPSCGEERVLREVDALRFFVLSSLTPA